MFNLCFFYTQTGTIYCINNMKTVHHTHPSRMKNKNKNKDKNKNKNIYNNKFLPPVGMEK